MAFWKKDNEKEKSTLVPTQQQASALHNIAAYNQTQYYNDSNQLSATSKIDPLEEEILRRFGRIRTALSPGTIIQGRLSFDSAVRIDGKLLGNVFSSNTLLIAKGAEVVAEIEADTVIVLGNLKGDVKARTKIELFPGAIVDASLSAPSLILQEGAVFQGKCLIK